MIRIGAIFTDDQKVASWQWSLKTIFTFDFSQDSPTELAFKYAVYKINKDPHILANRYFRHLLLQEHQYHDWSGFVHLIPAHPRSLVFDIQYVPREDSFRTTNKVSQTLHKNTKSRLHKSTPSPGVPTSELRDPGSFWAKRPDSWLTCPVSLRRTGNVSFTKLVQLPFIQTLHCLLLITTITRTSPIWRHGWTSTTATRSPASTYIPVRISWTRLTRWR